MPYLLLLRAHWKLGVMAILAASCLILWTLKEGEERRGDKLQFRVNELRGIIDDLADKSKAAAERAEKARQEAKRAGDKLRGQAERIEAPRPLSGVCSTPDDIMGADL